MKKYFPYAVGLIVGLGILLVVERPRSSAQLVMCDVGQGDGILITKGSNQVLIDGGPSSEKLLSCLGRHIPFWDRQIELIVLTNTDADHMNGLSAVVERYRVIRFVTEDGVHGSSEFDHFLSVVHSRSVPIIGVEQGEIVTVGERDRLTFHVLWPQSVQDEYMAVYSTQIDDSEREQILGASAKRGNLNEHSVVLQWDESSYKTLLMGDSGDQAEKVLLAGNVLSDINLLKVGHHGSKYATTAGFLSAIQPEIALISVGVKNRYGHPSQETLDRLSKIGAKIRRTDQEGEIVMEIPARR